MSIPNESEDTRSRISFPRRWSQIDPSRRGIVLAWLAFTVTFGGARLVTWLIQIDTRGFGDVSAGGVHLHHYLWGILLLAGVAIYGMVDRSPKTRTWMGLALGVALALIVDEAALLITLEDVYWQTEGWPSVALAISLIGIVGTGLVLTRSGAEVDDR
ncbi:hypothetical protein SAMN02745947_02065 [Rhodococcus rhodochrous J3]|uniref:Integral membrane protein n=2 Tax=Rhodococcus rhodochrous TaxID=1829 RepID=A0AA46WYL0_RHORH|nr:MULTISPECIES: hypothetical protein [Rhodococcus]MCR8694071.1 hypothetical protein [Rhodococcus pyridinivorans]MBF4481415.1 hypothetical protein [Rhodococcus rhodochrous]MCB8912735.1 hypothetical protein [Rhodococcus rhodochrous]MCD2096420.1 hypothetical protein [Rhodococcus rhodochrous]MCD2121362.1 hypothetical protein [Rhodococcus rhodochrous]